MSAESLREQLGRIRPVVVAGLYTHIHTSLDSNNQNRICTPELVSNFTYPSLARPHDKPFPTEMQLELSKPILWHTGKNNADKLHADFSENIDNNQDLEFSAQMS